jgi:hypothetical protein
MSLFQEGYKLYYKQMVDMCIFRNYFHFLSVPCISVFLQLRFPQLKFMLIYSVFFFHNRTAPHSGRVWKVNMAVQYQEILGYGAAVTDSVGINLGALDKDTRNMLLE